MLDLIFNIIGDTAELLDILINIAMYVVIVFMIILQILSKIFK